MDLSEQIHFFLNYQYYIWYSTDTILKGIFFFFKQIKGLIQIRNFCMEPFLGECEQKIRYFLKKI